MFFLLFVLGRMMPVVRILALLLKCIKLVDLLAAQEEFVSQDQLNALMTLLATHAKRPAPVNARKIQRVRMYVLVL